MCIFNIPVSEVKQTRIFVGPTAAGRQVTIYENYVGVSGRGKKAKELEAKQEKERASKNAMILPCPLSSGAQVQLLDLSKDGFKFDDLHACFPVYQEPPKDNASRSRHAAEKHKEAKLQVHQVGAYQMSIAPTLADLSRIDPAVFIVAPNIQELMSKHYANGFGFIICVFDPSKEIKPHPIGYVHDKLSPTQLFVPCRHEHGHGPQEKEQFDHYIYSANTRPDGEAGLTPTELAEQLDARAKAHGGSVRSGSVSPATVLQKSAALSPHFPQAIVLRCNILQGVHDNKDLVFTVAA